MNGDADALERYLTELRAELKARGVDDAGDLPDEIRSHVHEVTGDDRTQEAVSEALEAFGTPARLAASVASERAAGAIDSGPERAPVVHRFFGGLLDALWIAGVPLVLGVVSMSRWVWLAEMLWGPDVGQREAPLFVLTGPHGIMAVLLTLVAITWLAVTVRATVKTVGAGRPTVGMRAAGLSFAEAAGGRIVVRASSALAFGLAPVARRGRAIAGVLLVGLFIAAGAAWDPLMSALADRSMDDVQAAQDYCRQVVDMAYGAAMSRDPDAASGLREIFASSNMSFDDFARGLESDGIRANTEWGCVYRSDGTSTTIDVGAQEWAESKTVTPAYRLVYFTFERRDAAPVPDWFLVKVVRDPLGRAGGNGPSAEEARTFIERLLGESGMPPADRQMDLTDLMTESFAASEAALPLLGADRERPAFDRKETIDSIEFVDRFAVVTTTEWWLPEGVAPQTGATPAQRFVYRVLLARGATLVDGREPAK
jgi:hypothetical protein